MLTTTYLRNLTEVADDIIWAFGEEDGEKLLEADGCAVRVLAEATDGYWDIELLDGTRFDAISWYHLEGFTEDTTTATETRLVNYNDE